MNIRNCVLTSLLVLCSGMSSTTMAVGTGYSDDTELFVYDFAKAGDFRPKVLFIFDNSGSMGESTLLAKEDYDPEFSYPKLPQNDDGEDGYFYYSTNGIPPKIISSSNTKRFSNIKNACATSLIGLNKLGLFSSVYWNYVVSNDGKKGEWKPLSSYAESKINIVDCQQDISEKNNDNSGFTGSYKSVKGITKGYPVNTNSANISTPWVDNATPTAPNTGGGEFLTIYTGNYLRWYYASANIRTSRLNVAKQALRELVRSTPAVDFGLAVFNENDGNGNNNKNGGRIIRQIIGNDAVLAAGKTGSQDLIDKSNSLAAETWTPLCETMYEAYRYFGGLGIYFGNDDASRNPQRDPNAEIPSANKYKSPYDKCSNNGYIIYMTDGAPTYDTAADSLVAGLLNSSTDPNKPSYSGTVGYGTGKDKSYLAALAGYMKNNDVNASVAGKQTVTTFTVGFGDEAITGAGTLLAETARRGGGKYYPATDATQLNDALKSSLLAILKMNTSLVSPAIATNNFDRTRSLNNIYYAMFEPGAGPRWKGNLKKLALAPEKGYVVDQSGMPAIASDGTILEAARTFWSSTSDGNKVAEGGIQEMLSAKTNRNIYIIPPSINTTDALIEFSKSNLESMAGGATSLRTVMNLNSTDSMDDLLNWAKGGDAFDENQDGKKTDIREHILGDPLHSRPLVINYGCTKLTGQTSCTPDLRIVMGTNAGFLHMFKDSGTTVDESWAAMPYQFIANQKALRENLDSSVHLYGVDSSPTVLVNEQVKDGHIKSSQGDKVWLFTGLRGGGKAYYALNISNPDSPSLMWRLDKNSAGFGRLGETWSIPEVAFIPGYYSETAGKKNYKPVLIFSGGYDQSKSYLGQGVEDSEGLGIYIVDAEAGTLLFSFTPDATSATNKQVAGMVYSMPGSVSVLDSDGDGITDRIYAGDTGGQIWRIDLKGTDKPKWTAIKFASLGNAHLSGTAKKLEDDRRFFTQPVLVRTINKGWKYDGTNYLYSERPFDAVLIGSGDRNRPSSEAITQNVYVMLRDYNVNPTLFGATSEPSVPSSITLSDLYDVTSDPFIGLNEDQIVNTTKALTSKLGWKFWLNESGEKSMGAGLVLQGKLYFTSFLPQVQDFQQCTIQSIGAMRQYMIDMHYGTSFKYVLDSNNQEVIQRYVEVQNKVADDLVIHGGDDGRIRIIGGAPGKEVILKDDGQGEPERCTGEGECSQGAEEAKMDMSPKKIYLYEGEQG
ncbi:pilus assembly protein [Aeromonas allosaccharophila]|uniref:pilus assembly protein n=1 Tax=Aeromonas allosaccharophila TaxID=656 RepID=UPI000DD0E611